MQDIAYTLDDSIYLNITNRCTNACNFCIRYKTRKFQSEYTLWLDHEPTTEEILKAIGDPNKYKQIVFCGYGEPLIRLETVKEVASSIKSQLPASSATQNQTRIHTQTQKPIIRVDTNGQANLFHGRNILPELKDLIDIISISLNAESSETYNAMCNSFFGSKAHDAVLDFIKESKKYIPKVEISVVNMPNSVDIEKTRQLAKGLGVKFRIRTYYEEKYVP